MVVMLAIAVKCMMVQQEKVEMLQVPLAAKGETPWDGAGRESSGAGSCAVSHWHR